MGILSPWDAYPYFDAPTETVINLSAGASAVAAELNVRRVVLAFSVANGGPAVNISPLGVPDATRGFRISAGNLPFILTDHDVGALVQSKWYCFDQGGAGSILTVIELVLRDWPGKGNSLNEGELAAISRLLGRHRRADFGDIAATEP